MRRWLRVSLLAALWLFPVAAFAAPRAVYSGTGYVAGLRHDGDKIVFTIPDAQKGIYNVGIRRIRYSAPAGRTGYDLAVNGVKFSGMSAPTGDAFSLENVGKVGPTSVANTGVIGKGWGYPGDASVNVVGNDACPPDALKRIHGEGAVVTQDQLGTAARSAAAPL